jgi:hypothetical protein
MYTLGLDTIAGAKLLQVKFGRAGVFQPNQAVMHGNRRARFIRITNGVALIRHWAAATLSRFRSRRSRSSRRKSSVPLRCVRLPEPRHIRRTPLPGPGGSVEPTCNGLRDFTGSGDRYCVHRSCETRSDAGE